MARAARRWAVEEPASWALMYCSPVPGYQAPAELTVGPGTRVFGALFTVVGAGISAGDIRASAPTPSRATSVDFDGIRAEFDFTGDDAAVIKCLLVWAALVGAISLEVFGQYGVETLSDPANVFDGQIRLLIASLSAGAPGPARTRTRSSQRPAPEIPSNRCLTRHLSRLPG